MLYDTLGSFELRDEEATIFYNRLIYVSEHKGQKLGRNTSYIHLEGKPFGERNDSDEVRVTYLVYHMCGATVLVESQIRGNKNYGGDVCLEKITTPHGEKDFYYRLILSAVNIDGNKTAVKKAVRKLEEITEMKLET